MEKARRSSLRNPNVNDLQKMLNQSKHLNFELESIKEIEVEEVSSYFFKHSLLKEKRRQRKKIRGTKKTVFKKRI